MSNSIPQLLLNADLCTSCLQCEMACSMHHEGLFAPAFSRIKVFEFEHGKRNIPYTCTQCEEAWCPYGTVNFNTRSGKVSKCDLCDGEPACEKACPTGAIEYGVPA